MDNFFDLIEDSPFPSNVKMLPMHTFLETFDRKISRNKMDLSLYEGYWDCACGKQHWMIQNHNIICQGFWKVMVRCPNNPNMITAVKVKTKFLGMKFDDYESTAGTVVSSEEDRTLLSMLEVGLR